MKMQKEFVPYTLALELKELGFNESCFGVYSEFDKTRVYEEQYIVEGLKLPAPTFSQCFRWFREKHNLRSFVDTRVYDVDSPNQWVYDYQIKMGNGVDTQPFYSGDFDSYEDAELACLKKLIEIIKTKQNG